MDELRRDHIVKMYLTTGEYIEGEVIDYTPDRVVISVFPYSFETASKIKELDSLKVLVHTHLGIKEMKSSVIDTLNGLNCITIENSPTVEYVQRREFVRVMTDLKFKISKNNVFYDCVCINISAGGIAFNLKKSDIALDDIVTVFLPAEYFEKDILCSAKIIKKDNNWHVAQFLDLKPRDEDRIVKYVFKIIVRY